MRASARALLFRGLVPLGLVLASVAAAACSREEAPPTPQPPQHPEPAKPAAAVRVPDAPGTFEVRYYVLDKSCPYCRDLRRMIEGGPSDGTGDAPAGDPPLAKVYEGKVRFDFRRAFLEDTTQNPEMAPFGFAESAHGFVGIAPDGTVKFTMPGHHHTRGELVSAIDGMLR